MNPQPHPSQGTALPMSLAPFLDGSTFKNLLVNLCVCVRGSYKRVLGPLVSCTVLLGPGSSPLQCSYPESLCSPLHGFWLVLGGYMFRSEDNGGSQFSPPTIWIIGTASNSQAWQPSHGNQHLWTVCFLRQGLTI